MSTTANWETTDAAGVSLFTAAEWTALFSDRDPRIERFLEATYGQDSLIREEKREQYLISLDHYQRNYGGTDLVFIVRSPGRINLMGRHVDHRGGDINVIAINDECIAVVSPRQDDVVELSNSLPDRFADNSFSIGELVRDLELQDWFTCINSPKTIALVNDGDWENYIKAATLRLQNTFPDQQLRGMRMTVHSSVPIGSGLSSSSALVVATAKACIKVNDLPVAPQMLVDLCGEAEWFVGTRGGSGDHGAIRFGRRGEVADMSFFPFHIKQFMPFPSDYRILIVNSGIEAKKMQGARAEFNARVLAYNVAQSLFKLTFPRYADRIEHLRDINPQKLGVSLADLYEMLMRIPQEVAYDQIPAYFDRLPVLDHKRIADLLANDLPVGQPLYVRNVLLYGLAEIRRSRLFADCLRRHDVEALRGLYRASHDGDRVIAHDGALSSLPWDYQVTDEHLQELIEGLGSDDPAVREECQLEWQPGRYECSVPEIDRIVDLAYSMPGVLGAQMAGAGLGGCAMVIVEQKHCEDVMARYAAEGLKVRMYFPVNGAGVVSLCETPAN